MNGEIQAAEKKSKIYRHIVSSILPELFLWPSIKLRKHHGQKSAGSNFWCSDSFAGFCFLMLNLYLLHTKAGLVNVVQREKNYIFKAILPVSQRSVIFIGRGRVALLQANISRCWETDLGEKINGRYWCMFLRVSRRKDLICYLRWHFL